MKPTAFADKNGKTWDCKINLGSALLVDRSDFSVLTSEKIILSRYDQDSLKVIFTDTAVMFAVIGVLVRNQCKENLEFEITDEDSEDKFQQQFTASIEGPQIETARTALVEAVSDFFPAAKTVLSTFLKKLDSYRETVSKRLDSEILPMMDQLFEESLNDEMSKLKESLQTKANATSSASPPS